MKETKESKATVKSKFKAAAAALVLGMFLVPGSTVFAEGEVIETPFYEKAKDFALLVPVWLQVEVQAKMAAFQQPEAVNEAFRKDAERKAPQICDLTAYGLMVIASGDQIYNGITHYNEDNNDFYPVSALVPSQNPEDRVFYFNRDEGSIVLDRRFNEMIDDWADEKSSSLAQFKIDNGRHTFAVEKFIDQKDQPRFRLYQAYQGKYSLRESLGLIESSKIYNAAAFQAMYKKLGKGKTYTKEAMYRYLFGHLLNGLTEEMSSQVYSECFGGTDTVLIADIGVRIVPIPDPKTLDNNLKKLRLKDIRYNVWPTFVPDLPVAIKQSEARRPKQ
ncbi:MAG: hypothetical protein GY754_47135 [bacterium]|nr:hypothetical protein [bacterium]